jgi:mannose-1-phosphate guanylyltransferase/mannose-6-phosphate isomerase
MQIIPTIMCGGAGTRLWPASRDSLPKHLLPFNDGPSTFQRTVLRFKGAEGFGRPVIITSADARFLIAAQLQEIGVAADLILEPSRQDSAAAVATGAVHIAATRGDDVVCLILAADHHIEDAPAFRASALAAAVGAERGLIMTLGIAPTWPATGYGYVAPGDAIPGTACARLKAFKEKPDAATAAAYIAEGYTWNSGNFLFRPGAMLRELESHAPDILEAARAAYGAAARDADYIRLDATAFARARKTSIDFAVMEKTAQAGVAPYAGDWSDIGSFDALWEVMPKDADGNALAGDAVAVGSRNSLVQGDGVLAAAVGVEDLVIVAMRDAVLVSTRARSGEVKALVETLRKQGRSEADSHDRVHRAWGWRQTLDRAADGPLRRYLVSPGAELPSGEAGIGDANWIVVAGECEVRRSAGAARLGVGECLHLSAEEPARIASVGHDALELIAVGARSAAVSR